MVTGIAASFLAALRADHGMPRKSGPEMMSAFTTTTPQRVPAIDPGERWSRSPRRMIRVSYRSSLSSHAVPMSFFASRRFIAQQFKESTGARRPSF
jgi:hypothetical protein